MPTLTYALLGWPLGGGLSAAMHNAAFQALGLDAVFEDRATPPDGLADAVAELRGGFLAGANVTAPHKLIIRPLLDDESSLVTKLGAVNTVVWTPGGLVGNNTDVYGFERALATLDVGASLGKEAVVLGAGGAARAVVHVLLSQGYAVRVLSRSSGQSGTLAAALYRSHPGAVLRTGLFQQASIVEAVMHADLLVNATPLGGPSHLRRSPWPDDIPLPPRLAVLDLVAWPAETRLVRQALDAGCRAAGGGEMLLWQAAAAFELWTETPAPVDVMQAALAAARAPAAP